MIQKDHKYPKDYKGLRLKHINVAIEEATADIDKERSGEQHGLYCRWDKINRGMGKYWRFNHITQIAAPSGHGKSYVLNNIEDDLTELKDFYGSNNQLLKRALNRDFHKEVVLVHFGYEMDASDEVLRNIARKSKTSYLTLLSSEWDYETKQYNIITDEEYYNITNRMGYLKDRLTYFVEIPGNVYQMYYTVQYIKKLHPDAEIIVSIDHSLLVKRKDEKTDMEIIAAVAHVALSIKKVFKAMVIILGQMNNNIKSVQRKTNPQLHYPNDDDIYMGSQINWACDNIWIFPYRPELINLPEYGVDKINTKGLVVGACVKSRKGIICDVYFQENLAQGTFTEM